MPCVLLIYCTNTVQVKNDAQHICYIIHLTTRPISCKKECSRYVTSPSYSILQDNLF